MTSQSFMQKSQNELPPVSKGTHLKAKAGVKVNRDTVMLPEARTTQFKESKKFFYFASLRESQSERNRNDK